MLVVPLVWWHYLWVAVAALGIVLAGRGVDRRWLVALPIMAAVTVPVSLAYVGGALVGRGPGACSSSSPPWSSR